MTPDEQEAYNKKVDILDKFQKLADDSGLLDFCIVGVDMFGESLAILHVGDESGKTDAKARSQRMAGLLMTNIHTLCHDPSDGSPL